MRLTCYDFVGIEWLLVKIKFCLDEKFILEKLKMISVTCQLQKIIKMIYFITC